MYILTSFLAHPGKESISGGDSTQPCAGEGEAVHEAQEGWYDARAQNGSDVVPLATSPVRAVRRPLHKQAPFAGTADPDPGNYTLFEFRILHWFEEVLCAGLYP